MTATIVIPEASPSLNTFFHRHWRTEHAVKKRWALMLLARSRHVPKAKGKRRVVVQRIGKQALDHDNFVGGLKGCIDSMRKLGLLVDDDAAHLQLVCEQHRLPKGEDPHTVITITDIEPTTEKPK